MVLLVGIVIAIALVAIAAMKLLKGEVTKDEPTLFPFIASRPLTEREQVLYWRLRNVLPDQIVLAQVALSRMVKVDKGHDARAWLNRINRMTVDFLICLPDATIVVAIELDDQSHSASDRLAADAKKNKALESAGIKLLRFRDIPSEEELHHAFFK